MRQLSEGQVMRLRGAIGLAVGATILLSPRVPARLLGLRRSETNAASEFAFRLAGGRDLLIGAALLAAPSSEARTLIGLSTAVDVSDVAISLGAQRAGLPARAALSSAAAAAGSVVLTVLLLARRGVGAHPPVPPRA